MSVKFEDYYQVLGVARDATADEIKRAYRKLAQKLHPDRNKEPDAAERFSKVSEAYEVLKDPEKRQKYDQFGANYKAGQDFRPPPGFEGFGGGDARGFHFEGTDFSDFFQQMFGGTRGSGGGNPFGGAGGNPFGGQATPPREQEAEITIPLHEAYHGGTRQLTLSGGGFSGGGPDKKIDVKIPPKVKPGSKIRLKGERLILKINVAPDPRFKIEGANLVSDLKISPALAALGGKADVATLDGTVTMTIPPGIASGNKLRVRGKGLGQGASSGDQLVRVLIAVPKSLTDEQRELYEKLREFDAETDST
ncbi:MAG: DnaJ C-terminal domain-containing protein [Planctomycetota bacterium]